MAGVRHSIIIPTRNRAAWLSGCLDSIATLDFPNERFEVIVVNNGSRDSTDETVESEKKRGRFQLRCVREETTGSSIARNTGVQNAAGDFILFIEDDIRVAPGWLRAYDKSLSVNDSAIIQGQVILHFLSCRPTWLTNSIANLLGRVDANEAPGTLRGGNMAMPRELFDEIGGFRTDLGPGGIGMAEDSEFGIRAAKKGIPVIYEPEAIGIHLIPRCRVSRTAILKRFYRSGLSQPLFADYDEPLLRTLSYLARRSIGHLAGALFAPDSTLHMAELCRLMQHLGRVRQLMRMRSSG